MNAAVSAAQPFWSCRRYLASDSFSGNPPIRGQPGQRQNAGRAARHVLGAKVLANKPEDIGVTLDGNILTIRGQLKAEREEKDETYHMRERRVGSFARSITLPTTVDADKIEARYEDGVLKLRLPKAEEARPKRIEIKKGK